MNCVIELAKLRVAPHMFVPWQSQSLEILLESDDGKGYNLLLGFGTKFISLACTKYCRVIFLHSFFFKFIIPLQRQMLRLFRHDSQAYANYQEIDYSAYVDSSTLSLETVSQHLFAKIFSRAAFLFLFLHVFDAWYSQ